MKRLFLSLAVVLILCFLSPLSYAHTPLCSCSDEGDGTILCEGGFSDGSSAAGVKMTVVNASGKTLVKGKMNEDSEFTFKKPAGAYTVIFDAGPGHAVKIPSTEITE
jgi:type 1 fimbria pilin